MCQLQQRFQTLILFNKLIINNYLTVLNVLSLKENGTEDNFATYNFIILTEVYDT